MPQHVYARLAGFGHIVLPLAPFRYERLGGRPASLAVSHDSPTGTRAAVVHLGPPPRVELAKAALALEEILDLLPGPDLPAWRVETGAFTCAWPDGYALASMPVPPGFEFVGPNGEMVFLQGPFDPRRLPPAHEMIADGFRLLEYGRSSWQWASFEYAHEGDLWRQMLRVVAFAGGSVVVTSQAPAALAGAAARAGDEVAASLAAYDGE